MCGVLTQRVDDGSKVNRRWPSVSSDAVQSGTVTYVRRVCLLSDNKDAGQMVRMNGVDCQGI